MLTLFLYAQGDRRRSIAESDLGQTVLGAELIGTGKFREAAAFGLELRMRDLERLAQDAKGSPFAPISGGLPSSVEIASVSA